MRYESRASIIHVLPALLFLTLALIGCGGDGSDSGRTTTGTEPAASDAADRSGASEATERTRGGTLVIARAADTQLLDPAEAFEGESSKVLHQVFEGLVTFAPGSTEIQPGLAESWESSPDGRIWTFRLRRGVSFHDGTPFDADAVVFSIERQMDPEHPFHNGEFNTWHSTFERHVASVEATDSHTVRVTLSEAFAPILSGFAVQSMSIVSPTAMRNHGKAWFDSNGVGTGPFRVASWQKGDRIELVVNDAYWGERPYLDGVTFRVVPDTARRAELLANGEVHVAEDLDAPNLNRVKELPEIETPRKPGLATAYMAMNTTREPFDDVRVRLAVAHALNLPPKVRATFGDLGVPAKNYLPPVLWGYNETVPPYRYDPDRSSSLLAEAGVPDGFSFTLDVMENPRPYLPDPLEFARTIQERLGAVGIDVELRINSWTEHIERLIRSPEADYDACILGWIADMPDPNDFLFVQFHSSNADLSRPHRNMSLFRNDELDDLVERAQASTDRQVRTDLYRKAQMLIHREAPLLPIAHTFMVLPHRNEVKGIEVPVAIGNYGLEKVWLEGGGR